MRVALLLLLSAALVLPAGALAASPGNPLLPTNTTSPFSPGIPQSQAQQPTTTTAPPVITTTTSSGGALSGSSAVAIGIGALVVLAAISLFIWRDARRRAPVRQRAAALAAGEAGRTGSKPRPKPRKLSPAERRRRKRGRAK
jgi:hypothetical protein